MKKLEKKVDELLNSLSQDQSSFAMRDIEIAAGVATILSDWFNDGNKQAEKAAEGILTGIIAVIESDSKASEKIMRKLSAVAAKKALDKLKSLRDAIGGLSDDDGDNGGEDEDCENCGINRVCNLQSAINYRKEHGIPAPNKSATWHYANIALGIK